MSSIISPITAAPAQAAQDTEQAKQHARAVKATQDFESVFIGMMLKQMRKSMAGDNPIFGKSNEAKVYQDMMDDNMAKELSRTGTFGLARAMMKSIERTPSGGAEVSSAATKP